MTYAWKRISSNDSAKWNNCNWTCLRMNWIIQESSDVFAAKGRDNTGDDSCVEKAVVHHNLVLQGRTTSILSNRECPFIYDTSVEYSTKPTKPRAPNKPLCQHKPCTTTLLLMLHIKVHYTKSFIISSSRAISSHIDNKFPFLKHHE